MSGKLPKPEPSKGSTSELTSLVNKRLRLPMATSADRISIQTTTTNLSSSTNLSSLAQGPGEEGEEKYREQEVRLAELEEEEEERGKFKPLVEEEREGWDNKFQFILAVIGYAVGLGNVWRFPYLAQKNGGGAFLIPYTLMLLLEGIPIFYLELAIGQRLRKGAVGAWNQVHPYLGGIGLASIVVSLLVALYYNTIIAWCLFYFGHSFQSPQPWSACPREMFDNGTWSVNAECERSSPTQFFWYRETLDIATDIEHPATFNWKIMLFLLAAWVIVFLCMAKGIQSSGKVVYFTATFPYLVLIVFFFRGVTLPGAVEGIKHLFVPQWERLLDSEVWLEAATQIFFSLGLAFGGLIAFSSYMPVNNNVFRDTITVSLTNCGTSVFAGIVVFSILGFKAQKNYDACLIALNSTLHSMTDAALPVCDMKAELNNAASGTGLAFIAFTEAIDQLPGAPFWAVLFFLMLFTLGIDSMFGTLEGVITSVGDMNIFPGLKKHMLSGMICTVSFVFSLMFAHGAGNYVFTLFDDFSGNIPLLVVALMECIAVSYVYGLDRFSDDIELMTGRRPSIYWLVCWRYISPFSLFFILAVSVVKMMISGAQYAVWNSDLGHEVRVDWPTWALVFAGMLVFSAVVWIPLVWLVRYCNAMDYKAEEPSYFPEQELREHYDIQPHVANRVERILFRFKEIQEENLP